MKTTLIGNLLFIHHQVIQDVDGLFSFVNENNLQHERTGHITLFSFSGLEFSTYGSHTICITSVPLNKNIIVLCFYIIIDKVSNLDSLFILQWLFFLNDWIAILRYCMLPICLLIKKYNIISYDYFKNAGSIMASFIGEEQSAS